LCSRLPQLLRNRTVTRSPNQSTTTLSHSRPRLCLLGAPVRAQWIDGCDSKIIDTRESQVVTDRNTSEQHPQTHTLATTASPLPYRLVSYTLLSV
jgi:hypothetical protein